MELRPVDPRTLRFNPNNPRRTPSSPEADAMLDASITALGEIIQPPVVYEDADGLEIKYGERRVRAALRLGFPEIPVLVTPRDEKADAMAALAENTARSPLAPVDQWRAIEKLVALDWTEDAIATALALPVRTIRKLRLLANILPAMLDQMAKGDMPDERQLRIIAAASQAEQAQVWKKRKPKKTEMADWHTITHALQKRRMSAIHARFDDELAQAYGIVWLEDLFEQAGEDNRYTTNAEGFFGAQQEWLGNNLPPNGIMLTFDQNDRPLLPKGAERIWSKPGKNDHTGWYLEPQTGAVASIAYRMPQAKPEKGKNGKAGQTSGPTPRPPLTQKGAAMLGDFRTDALHQALREAPVESETLLALLVLAFSGSNVSVTSASADAHYSRKGRAEIVAPLVVDGAVTVDGLTIVKTAREMLTDVLSCRENASRSGVVAALAGATLGADDYLPNLATADFVACMSREQVEQAARDAGLPVKPKLKDTRASLIARFGDDRFIPALARFQPTQAELELIDNYRSIEDDAAPPGAQTPRGDAGKDSGEDGTDEGQDDGAPAEDAGDGQYEEDSRDGDQAAA